MSTSTETRTGIYEGMFLVSQAAAADFAGLIEHINHLFERASATVVAMKKWDERRLAYEIDKQKRGIYILAYFTCPTDQVAQLERDAQISDQIMRLMVTTADHLTDEEIKANDDRQGLKDEAKLKAEQGTQEDAQSSGARLGAPEQSQQDDMNRAHGAKPTAAPAPEASDEGDDADSDDSDDEN
jgi:small subunit ribosomal protein S6